MSDKPFSAACERNREPILTVLHEQFADCARALEIGSGTGQHAVYFGTHLPHLSWQTSDVPEYHDGIHRWIADDGPANVRPPLTLDVASVWPDGPFDAVFSANTLHIMGWDEVRALFAALPDILTPHASVVIYGPFHDRGQATSDSNARFDASLRSQTGDMGIRDAGAVDALAAAAGLQWRADIAMPANNRCLVWQRTPGRSSWLRDQ